MTPSLTECRSVRPVLHATRCEAGRKEPNSLFDFKFKFESINLSCVKDIKRVDGVEVRRLDQD